MLIVPVMARDVQQGDTIYVGEENLNLCPALPSKTHQICNWDSNNEKWDGCNGISCKLGPVGVTGLTPADWYAITTDHMCSVMDYSVNPNGTVVEYLSGSPCNNTESRDNFVRVFTVRPADEMPTPEPTTEPTTEATPDLEEKIAALETNVSQQNASIAAVETQISEHGVTLAAHEVTLETLMATTSAIPTPTETINQSATIEALQSQLAAVEAKNQEQDNLLDTIWHYLFG